MWDLQLPVKMVLAGKKEFQSLSWYWLLFNFSNDSVVTLNKSQAKLRHQASESAGSQGSEDSHPPKHLTQERRHSLNPANIQDFFRRVSISSRRFSLRHSNKRKSRSERPSPTPSDNMASTSQPHLNQILKRAAYDPQTGLDRTRSVSGTFFRRTQSN